MLCCVTTHLSGMCEVVLERLSTTFTLNHLCSHRKFHPRSKLPSSQPSHKSLPPSPAPSALHAALAPGILLLLADLNIGHCVHETFIERHGDTRLQENFLRNKIQNFRKIESDILLFRNNSIKGDFVGVLSKLLNR